MKIYKQILVPAFCACPPSGNQVDGLPLAPSKIYKQMHIVDYRSIRKLIVNHSKSDSSYVEVSNGAIKWLRLWEKQKVAWGWVFFRKWENERSQIIILKKSLILRTNWFEASVQGLRAETRLTASVLSSVRS